MVSYLNQVQSYTIGLIISSIIFFELIIVIGGWKYKPDLVNQNILLRIILVILIL